MVSSGVGNEVRVEAPESLPAEIPHYQNRDTAISEQQTTLPESSI